MLIVLFYLSDKVYLYLIIRLQTKPRDLFIKDPDIESDAKHINQNVNSQNSAPEEKRKRKREFEQPQQHQSKSLLPDPEDSPIVIDWNPDESYQTRP